MHSRQNWDDLRFVLAVALTGSVTAAGKQLSVNHATVLRRVAAFEEAFGLNLFEKTVRGYRVTPGNQAVLDALAETEDAVLGVARAVSGANAPLTGTVRVTSTDTFCSMVLPRVAGTLAARAPDLKMEIISSNLHLNFARLDADLTVRPTNTLPEDLEGEVVGELTFGTYCAVDAPTEDWIGLASPISRAGPSEWMAANIEQDRIVASADSFITIRQLVAMGRGCGFFPDLLARSDPRVQRIDVGAPDLSIPVWVAGHRDLADVPRLRAARDLLGTAIREEGSVSADRT